MRLSQTLVLVVIMCLISAFDEEKKLTEAQAVKLAEQFIKDNGYTTYPADTSKFHFEFLDGAFGYSMDSILKQRRNTLYPRAYCIIEGKDAWYVGFVSTSIRINMLSNSKCNSDLRGESVMIKKDGSELHIKHETPLFSRFRKLRKCREPLLL